MTSRAYKIPGRTYTLVKAIDGDKMTAEADRWLSKPGVDGNAGIAKSKGQVYLAIERGWKIKQED